MSRKSNGGADGFLAIVLLAVFLLPMAGLYVVKTGDDAETKAGGVLMTIIGIIIWIIVFIGSQCY